MATRTIFLLFLCIFSLFSQNTKLKTEDVENWIKSIEYPSLCRSARIEGIFSLKVEVKDKPIVIGHLPDNQFIDFILSNIFKNWKLPDGKYQIKFDFYLVNMPDEIKIKNFSFFKRIYKKLRKHPEFYLVKVCNDKCVTERHIDPINTNGDLIKINIFIKSCPKCCDHCPPIAIAD